MFVTFSKRGARLGAVALIAIALALVSLPQSGPGTASAGGTATPTPSPGDLAVTKTDSADPVLSGAPYTYTITITNIGQGPVGGHTDQSTGEIIPVGLIDALPSNFIATGFTVDFGGACFLSTPTDLRCDFGQFLAGQSATVTITGYVVSSSTITVYNNVLVDLPISLVPETVETANNHALQSTTIAGPEPTAAPTPTATPSPGDLAVTKTDSADPVLSGAPYTYTITITNIGQGPVGGHTDQSTGEIIPVGLIDALPSNFIATGFTVDFGGVCFLSTPTYLRCDFGQFPAGQSATVTITGYVVSSSTITVKNIVAVDLPISLVAETIEVGNNFASQSTTIAGPAPTATPSPVPPTPVPPTPASVGGVSFAPPGDGGADGSIDSTALLVLTTSAAALAVAAWYARRRI